MKEKEKIYNFNNSFWDIKNEKRNSTKNYAKYIPGSSLYI